ncbi:LysR family transcriptional regulator [Arthrobacter sulfonylureivorans]|uniref:LysR family transcriptional regulator n=1 Tax=Arthrobacter sulfonylureivorans TaxID=2486855 RepID=A0ABY3W4I8_9MICC|nr:LysR family transcriptional regulator [Arthrobacter sulfonylureivorans]UNK45070.1 LysR family transcriptional regulator [Arthrobacter sulfonylureivorans]
MSMTLNQLKAFALVARLGSLRAAAAELAVSEPAVSAALAALRQDLGDPLFVRAGGGIALTPGGRALAAHAQEIVGLADHVRREVAQAEAASGSLRVLATADFAEHAAGRLVDYYTRRVPGATVDVVVEPAADMAALLANHAYDIALGSRPQPPQHPALEAVPFLRYQRVLVASPGHPLARLEGAALAGQLPDHRWFTGPAGLDGLDLQRWLGPLPGPPETIEMSSETSALAAVRSGEGIMLALEHIVRSELVDGLLARLPAAGTPLPGLWWASTLDHGRATAAARTLQRIAGTAQATAAMVAPGGPRGLARRGSKVHVALWS